MSCKITTPLFLFTMHFIFVHFFSLLTRIEHFIFILTQPMYHAHTTFWKIEKRIIMEFGLSVSGFIIVVPLYYKVLTQRYRFHATKPPLRVLLMAR